MAAALARSVVLEQEYLPRSDLGWGEALAETTRPACVATRSRQAPRTLGARSVHKEVARRDGHRERFDRLSDHVEAHARALRRNSRSKVRSSAVHTDRLS